MRLLPILAILCLWAGSVAAADRARVIDDFEKGMSSGWREKSFAGHTDYRVVAEGTGHVLQADSQDAASGLIYEVDFVPKKWPIIAWRWKIEGVLPKGDAHAKSGDDYPARLYVVFPHWLFFKTRSLNYIWANRLPKGSMVPNPFTGNAMMIAVESGPGKAGRWVEERRNVIEDFRRAFGEDPPEAGAIAVMTDTDNTGGRARAWYDDIRLEGASRPSPASADR
jgi:hypothetical protein